MTTIHFIGGEKGGVGKSVVARLLAQSFVDRSLPFVAFDADRSNAALLRYYSDFSKQVDLDRLESADQILESAIGSDRPILVDLPAQSHRALSRWFEQTDVVRCAREEGVSLVFWHVTDGGFDSVTHLERLLETLGGSVQFVVVENLGRSKDFSQFDASPARQRLLELGGRVVALPELDASVMYKIDRFGSSFWAAINTSDGPRALSRLERRRAKVWLDRAHAALDPASAAGSTLASTTSPSPANGATIHHSAPQNEQRAEFAPDSGLN
jgi:CobQ/CobB/MinD/ParA family nucleotide binding protein